MKRVVICFAAFTTAAFVLTLTAADGPATRGVAPEWPQYRGSLRDGVAAPGGSPPVWPESGPKVSWKLPLGSAFSQLAVSGDALFTGTSDEEKDYLVRLDAITGKELWRTPLGEVFVHNFGNGPRSTPTVDGDRVYLLGAKGNLLAAKANDGSPIWNIDLKERFGAEVPRFGYSGSPLVVDDLLLVEVGAKDQGWVAALDKNTGDTKWTVLSGPAGYTSSIAFEFGGSRQVVLMRGKTVTSLDLEGNVLWTYELPEAAIAMPLLVGDDRVFVSSMGDTGCVMLRMIKTASGFEVEELWKNRNMRNHFNSSVLVGDYIYGFDNATLKCLSAEDGELMWAKRGFGKGSVVVSGDHLLVLGDKGKVALVKANPAEYRERGSYQALEGKSWTAPSMTGGRLYLRNLTEMTCLDLRG
jgi:outer membrane protein assembly factor BamB